MTLPGKGALGMTLPGKGALGMTLPGKGALGMILPGKGAFRFDGSVRHLQKAEQQACKKKMLYICEVCDSLVIISSPCSWFCIKGDKGSWLTS